MTKGAEIRRWSSLAVGLALLALVVATNLYRVPVDATHQPADKVIARGSKIEVMKKSTTEGTLVEHLMGGTLRTSSPSDLIFSLTAECALWTTTANEAAQNSPDPNVSETEASVQMLVTVDYPGPKNNVALADLAAYAVPVTLDGDGNGTADDPDDGNVVFCNRAHRMDMQWVDGSDDDDDDDNDSLMLKSYLRTRSANGFNWLKLNLGNGIHNIDVWGVLEAKVVQDTDGKLVNHPEVEAPAAAAIGKRTLIVTPTKLANDASY